MCVCGDRGLPLCGTAVKAVVAHIYSNGSFLPVVCHDDDGGGDGKRKEGDDDRRDGGGVDEEGVVAMGFVEMRAAAEAHMLMMGKKAHRRLWSVDEEGVMEAFALADLWCLDELKANYLRYFTHTWALHNAVDRSDPPFWEKEKNNVNITAF